MRISLFLICMDENIMTVLLVNTRVSVLCFSLFLFLCEISFLHDYTSARPLPSSHLIFAPTESPASVLQRANIASGYK